MAFQDFDQISLRRKQERQKKIKRRITIATASSVGVLLLAAAAVCAVAYKNNLDADTSGHSESHSAPRQVVTADKAVKWVCAGTDYEQTCEDSLSKAVKDDATAQPKDILKAAFSVASDEIDKVIKQASSLKFDSPLKKAAFDDCLVLLNDAKEELNSSISSIEGKDLINFSSKTGDLNNWLSAVLSYQQTCIDGFPEGKEKDALKKILKTTRELGSNALAITSQFSSIFSILQVSDVKRNLLSVEEDGFPSWRPENVEDKFSKNHA